MCDFLLAATNNINECEYQANGHKLTFSLQSAKSETSPWPLLSTAGVEIRLSPHEKPAAEECRKPQHRVALQMATMANKAEQHNSSWSLMEPKA